MRREVWEKIEALFVAAKNRPSSERAAFLQQACPGNFEVRAEVEELLKGESDAESFLESSPLAYALPSGTKLGHFEIQHLLGRGGMGEVYRARDTRLNRNVAIKMVPLHLSRNPSLLNRLKHEARVISVLNHPHICTLYDIGSEGGVEFLVMEYLEGQTLTERLAKGPLPIDKVLRHAIETADALASTHRNGVFHGDLKPGNIMLTKCGAKVLDFGLAKMQEIATGARLPSPAKKSTEEGVIQGTLQYMAPEQLEGGEIDARTDIFAFGLVLHEMSTGQRAFKGESRASLVAAILEHEPDAVCALNPAAPAGLGHVVSKCLAKDPEARWQTALDLRDELQWIAVQNGGRTSIAGVVSKRAGWIKALIATAITLVTLFAIARFRERPPEQRVVRFSVYAPERVIFDDAFAVSPDGSRVVFIGYVLGADASLWIHRLDSLASEALSGTEGANEPFWSPDGRFIAFFAHGKLKKIDLSTRTVQSLCDAGVAGGGTWSEQGTILFPLNGVLYRVAADGGSPAPLTSIREQYKGVANLWPHFLPDGKHFLYTSNAWAKRNEAVYVGSLDSKETIRLLDSHSRAAYVTSSRGEGFLLFVRDGNLMAQKFSADSLRVSGAPVAITESIFDLAHPAYFGASASGTLMYRRAVTDRTELTWFDRAGKKVGTTGRPLQDVHAMISPDGQRIAVSRGNSESGNTRASTAATSEASDIWILDQRKGGATRLTFNSSADYPVWSQDGSRIAFSSHRDGVWDLYEKSANGVGQEELLVKSNQDKFATDFSRDGRFLAYASFSLQTGFDIWVLPLQEDRRPFPFLHSPAGEAGGSFSPDGRWVAYHFSDSGHWNIYVRRFRQGPSDDNSVISDGWAISTENGHWPHWRADGKELFYLRRDETIMAVPVDTGISDGEPTIKSGLPRALFNVRPYGLRSFAVTPNGDRFLLNVSTGDESPAPITVVLNWQSLLPKGK